MERGALTKPVGSVFPAMGVTLMLGRRLAKAGMDALPVKNALSVIARRSNVGGGELRISCGGHAGGGHLQGVAQAGWKGPEHIPKAELHMQASCGWDSQRGCHLAPSSGQDLGRGGGNGQVGEASLAHDDDLFSLSLGSPCQEAG